MKLKTLASILFATLSVPGVAQAGELFDLYRQALSNDARYAVAKARVESAQEAIPLAVSNLLPRISVGANYGRTILNNDSAGFFGNVKREYYFNPQNYSAVLAQPLYRQASYEAYWQAEWQTKEADAQLNQSLDELKTRLTQMYLQVQLASAQIQLIEQQKLAYAKIRQQAQRSYESGYGTVTEIAESQSRLDELLAEDTSARAQYNNRLTELRNVIGNPAFVPQMRSIPSFMPDLHEGRSLQDWLALARQNAPAVKAQQARVQTARYELAKAKANYLPTLDLRVQLGYDKDSGYTTINTTNNSKSVMLSFNMPLYEGGQTASLNRRAAADLIAAQQSERGLNDELAASVEKEFGNVTAQVVKINALKKFVETNELLVKATEKSVGAGVRTNVDVLNAESRLFEARLKLTSARIDYLQALVNLRAAAGAVQDDELQKIDDALRDKAGNKV